MSLYLLGLPGKIKTLLDRLTDTRAGYLDRIDATVSSRAPANSALSNNVWTNARAAKLDLISSAPSAIKSIQRGTITVNSTANVDVTVSPVSVAKSVLILSARAGKDNNGIHAMPSGYLASSTKLVFNSSSLGTGAAWPIVEWQLVEFN